MNDRQRAKLAVILEDMRHTVYHRKRRGDYFVATDTVEQWAEVVEEVLNVADIIAEANRIGPGLLARRRREQETEEN